LGRYIGVIKKAFQLFVSDLSILIIPLFGTYGNFNILQEDSVLFSQENTIVGEEKGNNAFILAKEREAELMCIVPI
jgi:hypothetical protein